MAITIEMMVGMKRMWSGGQEDRGSGGDPDEILNFAAVDWDLYCLLMPLCPNTSQNLELNPCPAEPGYILFCKQCRSRSVGFSKAN